MKTFYFIILASILSLHATSQNYKKANEASGIPVGREAPLFTATDAHNKSFSLNEALAQGPVVLIFYRGVWCPYCNRHLSEIQDSLKLIESSGAQVVAISAQKPEYLAEMEKETGASFTLLSDEGFKISDAYGVSFKPSGMTTTMYNTALNAKLKKSQTDDSQRLPIPATYVINKEGKVSWRQFDPDYKNRSSVADILTALSKTD